MPRILDVLYRCDGRDTFLLRDDEDGTCENRAHGTIEVTVGDELDGVEVSKENPPLGWKVTDSWVVCANCLRADAAAKTAREQIRARRQRKAKKASA